MSDALEITAGIVAAYLARHDVPLEDLPRLITSTRFAIEVGERIPEQPPQPAKEPAVPIKKSITPDFLICLEDGVKLKSLKRHLRQSYNLTPAQYRAKWGLPSDYPMVSPNYSAARSELAKSMGLGRVS